MPRQASIREQEHWWLEAYGPWSWRDTEPVLEPVRVSKGTFWSGTLVGFYRSVGSSYSLSIHRKSLSGLGMKLLGVGKNRT